MRTRWTTAGLVAAGLFLTACGVGGSEPAPTSEAPQSSPLASFDPCTVLSPEELQAFGVDPDMSEPTDEAGEVGCKFMGDPFFLGLMKSDTDLAGWQEKQGNFDRFEPNTVAGRNGFLGVTKGSTGQGVCSQTLESGGGSVVVQVSYSDMQPGETRDPCEDALKVADQVASKLPK